jgi:hypothetical protein
MLDILLPLIAGIEVRFIKFFPFPSSKGNSSCANDLEPVCISWMARWLCSCDKIKMMMDTERYVSILHSWRLIIFDLNFSVINSFRFDMRESPIEITCFRQVTKHSMHGSCRQNTGFSLCINILREWVISTAYEK